MKIWYEKFFFQAYWIILTIQKLFSKFYFIKIAFFHLESHVEAWLCGSNVRLLSFCYNPFNAFCRKCICDNGYSLIAGRCTNRDDPLYNVSHFLRKYTIFNYFAFFNFNFTFCNLDSKRFGTRPIPQANSIDEERFKYNYNTNRLSE